MLPVSQRELKNLTAICIFGAAEEKQETSGRSFWDSEVKARRGSSERLQQSLELGGKRRMESRAGLK